MLTYKSLILHYCRILQIGCLKLKGSLPEASTRWYLPTQAICWILEGKLGRNWTLMYAGEACLACPLHDDQA